MLVPRLIEPLMLKQGWYLAHEIKSEGKSSLCLVWVQGRQPFLRVWTAIAAIDSIDWYRSPARNDLENDVQWEFVQRIELPQEVTA